MTPAHDGRSEQYHVAKNAEHRMRTCRIPLSEAATFHIQSPSHRLHEQSDEEHVQSAQPQGRAAPPSPGKEQRRAKNLQHRSVIATPLLQSRGSTRSVATLAARAVGASNLRNGKGGALKQ